LFKNAIVECQTTTEDNDLTFPVPGSLGAGGCAGRRLRIFGGFLRPDVWQGRPGGLSTRGLGRVAALQLDG